MEELKNKKIGILGLGVEGLATAEYFLSHKIPFIVLDEKSEDELLEVGEKWQKILNKLHANAIPLILGKQLTPQDVELFDIVVRSPGISLRSSFLKNFQGIVTSHTKLFFDYCPCQIIGVTGTKGKGTTSSLIYEMLKKGGFDAYLGGNIGLPPLSFLDNLHTQSYVVLELSSFQLQDMQKSPHIAVMLMVTQEHLDDFFGHNYHKDLNEYWEAKRIIVRFQTVDDMAVLNTDYEGTRMSAGNTPAKVAWVSRYQELPHGCFVRNNEVIIRTNGTETKVIDVKDILLPGGHNLENVCAAVMAAYFAGISVADISFVLQTFKGLEHRLELVRTVDGVRYYDDSFSTTPETAIAAISSFREPEILIVGGSKKGSDFTELGKVISEAKNIKAIIGIGIEWPTIMQKIPSTGATVIEGLTDIKSIVAKAHQLSKPGDVVLLSPACASFDMFKNYKERGRLFKEEVNLL